MAEHFIGGAGFRGAPPAESLAYGSNFCRRGDLGGRLSESAKYFCAGRVAFDHDLGAGIHLTGVSFESLADRLQVFWLGLRTMNADFPRLDPGLKNRGFTAVPVEQSFAIIQTPCKGSKSGDRCFVVFRNLNLRL